MDKLNPREIENISEEYIKSLKITNNPTNKKYFIGLIGSYGVGKTTVASKIAEELPSTIVSTDNIRRLLEKKGLAEKIIDDNQNILPIAIKALSTIMDWGVNIILDADLREHTHLRIVREKTITKGYKLILLHIISPEEITKKRITDRNKSEISNVLKTNMEKHFKNRKEVHTSHTLPSDIFYTFETNKPLDKQIKNFLNKLNSNFNFGK